MKPPLTITATCLLAASLLCACSGELPRATTQSTTGSSLAALAPTPGFTALGPAGQAFRPYLFDANQAGLASSLHLVEARWGRLVQVFDLDSSTQLRQLAHSDFLVGAAIASDGVDYELSENLAGQAELTILHRRGSPAFQSALVAAENATLPIADNALPPWSVVPRNAALSLRFDDLLDAATLDISTVKLFVGTPALVPIEVRLFIDANHGSVADPDGDGAYEFYSTRVIADLAVTQLEAAMSFFPLAINNLGLPAALNAQDANLRLRLPTTTFPPIGQTLVLANPAGNGLDLSGNGSVDLSSLTKDVTRDLRSGGSTAQTGDPFEGFLQDNDAPRLVAELSMSITGSVTPEPDVVDGYRVSAISFNSAACAGSPEPGDLLLQGGSFAVVYDPGQLNGNVLNDLRVRVLSGAAPSGGLGQLRTALAPPVSNEQCFAHYLPLPILAPNRGVSPQAQVRIVFDEPMSADTIDPLESFTIASVPGTPGALDSIVGAVVPDPGLRAYIFVPSMPLPHQLGANETLYVRVGTKASPTDLAGNALAAPLGVAQFQLDANAPSELSGNLSLRFDSTDMLNADGAPELRGQFLFDLQAQAIEPRPLVHFEGNADRTNALPAIMTPFLPGVQTPLVPLGSKLHNVWRYADMGFSLLDETNTNVDVEGLSWAPVGGQVIADVYDEFSIQLGHANVLPDEVIDSLSGFPKFPTSGLATSYAQNYADSPALVHERALGYLVNPADLFASTSGTLMLPFPLNRNVAPEDRKYFTWRDTALLALGGSNGSGAPFEQEILVNGGVGFPHYNAGQVPSIGLPLLMEYRCYPTTQGLGLNAFDISLAANSSARPNLRAFSAGGINSGGTPIIKDPDLENVASGGFSPGLGQATLPADNSYYIGAADLVTRISRAHTMWFDTQSATANFGLPSVVADLPAGTEVRLSYRGATAIQGGTPGALGYIAGDSTGLDMYGDSPSAGLNGAPTFLNGVSAWTDDITQVNGARYFQVRLTFSGNAVSGSTSTLGSLGFAWTE